MQQSDAMRLYANASNAEKNESQYSSGRGALSSSTTVSHRSSVDSARWNYGHEKFIYVGLNELAITLIMTVGELERYCNS